MIEVVAETNDPAALVAHHEIERDLVAEPLRNGDFAGKLGRSRRSRRVRRNCHGNEQPATENTLHGEPPVLVAVVFPGAAAAVAGNPFANASFIASSIGMCTIPFCGSTQP